MRKEDSSPSSREWHADVEPARISRSPTLLRDCLLALVDATPGLVMVSNSSGQLLYMNGTGRRILGIDPDESILSRWVRDVYAPRSRQQLLDDVVPTCLSHGMWRGEMFLQDHEQSEVPVSQVLMAHHVRGANGAETTVLSSIAWDIREMKQVEHQLRHQATHDALTGLPNRAMLMDCLSQSLRHAQHAGTFVGVLFLDLDGFKQINDNLGHETANQLLRALGHRLKRRVRAEDVVARYGGDEFVLVISKLAACADIAGILEQVHAAIQEPFAVAGESLRIKASIGLAMYPGDGDDADALLRRADNAMYRQKRSVKSTA